MFWRGRSGKRGDRREPRFDMNPERDLDLRLSADDRAHFYAEERQQRRPRRAARREPDYAAYEDDYPDEDQSRLRSIMQRGLPDHDDREPPYMTRRDARRAKRQRRGGILSWLFGLPRGGRRYEEPRVYHRRRGGGGIFRRLFYYGFIAGIWGGVAVGGLIAYEATKLPPMHALEIPPRPPSITIVSTAGTALATRGEGGGGNVPLKALPPYLPKAFIAIEDRRFYSHFGVDPLGLARAVFTNLRAGGTVQGGSTITQQLAKNLFLTPERSMERKIQEVILAVWLEARYSKDQLLELYLNRVYFGSGAYGVEAASQRYFNKSASHVTLAEAAILAGLVKAPSRLAPTRNMDAAEARAQLVLAAMAEEKFITDQDAARALSVPAAVAKPRTEGSAGYVADWVMDQLDGIIGQVDKDILVDTTIDPILQAEAEQALVEELDQNGEKLGVSQGALVAVDPNGAVKALVGGRSYADSQFNRAVTARRQPGSSFKPFVYLTAMEHGLTPETVRPDAPLKLKGWNPENFDQKYRGPVTLTQALATSLNTVAVRLCLEVGPQNVVDTAQRLGITAPLSANPSIALGTSEVSPLEMAAAYVPFANGGYAVQTHVIRRVRLSEGGQSIYERQGSGLGEVIAPDVVGMMNAMLSETLRIGTAKKAELPGWPAAGKTGTSQDYRDAWFIGYTSHFVTSVWLGNDDNSPTKKASGSNLPVEIWSRFMTAAHRGVPIASLPGNYQPAGGETEYYDPQTTGVTPPQTGGATENPWIPPPQPRGSRRHESDGPVGFFKRLFGG